MKVIRWGIVGCGLISGDFVKALKTVLDEGHEISAVAARDTDRAREFADLHGIAKSFGSYEELAADAEIDVVYIGTVASCHYAQCKLFMSQGKHVLCEKPMGMNADQVRALVKYAATKKVFLMEAMWARFNPVYLELQQQIAEGVIGDVVHVSSTFGFDLSSVESVSTRRAGGGSLIHGGIYNVHLALTAFGSRFPEKILSTGNLNSEGMDTDDCTILGFPGGKTASWATNCSVELPNEAFVVGTKGIIKIEAPFCSTTKLVSPKGEFITRVPEELEFVLPNSYILRYEAIHVGDCIRQGKLESERMSWKDSVVMHEIMDTIRREIGVNFDQEHRLVAAAARDAGRAKEFAEKFGFAKSYGSYEEMAQDPEIEVVYIGTLCRDHVAHSKLFMDHGKNVLCEKPLSVNVEEVRALTEYAKEKNLFLMEFHMFGRQAMWARINPVYIKMREEIDKGTIGEVLHVNNLFGYDQKFRDWMYRKDQNGGGLLDMGVYNAHLATMVFWRERPVDIVTTGFLNDDGVDTSTTTTLVYSGGRTAVSVTSIDVFLPNQAVIVGTKGSMILRSPFWTSPELVTPTETFKFPEPGLATNFPRSYFLRNEAIEVRKCLKAGLKQSPRMTWEDSILMHDILTQVRRKNGVIYEQDLKYQ
ncbi:unnamed protein product [Notodromas monacha]|uniref:Trans-1,2-dihydrobenzene-1,2-diol dehydrogenase n=1 Tax=Notodromas monacha TaxID=399045 RepID=A0A7R9GA93_9CRUS|nr:unnamed protein product [Notodromas monacha]CAG0913759.1 unnamed protein product [Notodromas monacha]